MRDGWSLTEERRTLFREQGYLLLEGALPRARLSPVRERILSELSRHGINSSGRGVPKSIAALPVFQQITKLSQLVDVPDLTTKIILPCVTDAIEALAQTRVSSSQSLLLLSPPNQGAWRLDGLNWHTDISSSDQKRIPGIQAFVIVDDLERHGGATLLLSGSHRLANDAQANARVRDALRKGKEGETALRQRDLSIVELSGRAGDVYLVDMRVLHTPSVNASKRLRMVATARFFLA